MYNFGHGLGLDVVKHTLVNTKGDTPMKPNIVITVYLQPVSRSEETAVLFADVSAITEGDVQVPTTFDFIRHAG